MYVKSDGTVAQNTTGVAPVGSILLWTVVCNGSGVTSTTDGRDASVGVDAAMKAQSFTADGSDATFYGANVGVDATHRHTIPNVANDTLVLLAATQTLSGKTLTAPTITGLVTLNIRGSLAGSSSTVYGRLDAPAGTLAFTGGTAQTGDIYGYHMGQMTLTNVTAGVVVNAGTLVIDGAPVAGSGVTITNPYAVWVKANKSRFDGDMQFANLAPSGNFTITQNSVAVLTSISSGAIVNTLYLNAGKVGIGTNNPTTLLYIQGAGDDGVTVSSYGGQSVYYGARAGGSRGSESNLAVNDKVLNVAAYGWVGGSSTNLSQFVTIYTGNGTTVKADIVAYVSQSGAPSEILRLANTGLVSVTGTFSVSSTMAVTGASTFSSASFSSTITVANNVAIQMKASGGTAYDVLLVSTGNDTFLRAVSGGDLRIAAPSGGQEYIRVTTSGLPTSGQTGMWLVYHNGTSVTIQQVTVGATDSGGSGFKYLRIPN